MQGAPGNAGYAVSNSLRCAVQGRRVPLYEEAPKITQTATAAMFDSQEGEVKANCGKDMKNDGEQRSKSDGGS